ncbi:unnamed protein product [Parnassius mnemosyne]|uniref:CCHC-type domain-containing protein n=1 Tax=Parnassius mnemosyne TaxID=213953 RepID=A0AAV1LHM1_9NEOP
MAEEKIQKLIKLRSSIKSKVTILNKYVKVLQSGGPPSDLQLLDLEGRFKKFDALYAQYDELQSQIEVLSDDSDTQELEREEFEGQYYSLAAAARSVLGARPARQYEQPLNRSLSSYEYVSLQQTGAFKSNCVRLPKIDLPVFNGHYQHSLEFRDTYISLIHSRQDIDNINKLHYLRASLRSSALLVIDNLDFKAENYNSAWNLLCSRYDNKRLLVNYHVRELFNVEHMRNESCKGIRRLIDVTNKNLRALTTLDQPTQHWDTLIIHMMAEKLDSVTHREWEEYRNTLNNPPSLETFTTFLSNRADLLETLQESKNKPQKYETYKTNTNLLIATNTQREKQNFNKKTTYLIKKIFTCPLCNQNHFLFTCETFRALPIEIRIQKAKESNVCLNCLRPGHLENNCNLSSCKYYKKRHNTLLHLHEPQPIPEPAMPSTSSINHFANSSESKQVATPPLVLLSTALVKVLDGTGAAHSARMLLDNGSTANFVMQSLCGKLGLSRRSVSSTVTDF